MFQLELVCSDHEGHRLLGVRLLKMTLKFHDCLGGLVEPLLTDEPPGGLGSESGE